MKKILTAAAILMSLVLLFTAAHADDNPVMYGAEQLTALMDNLASDIQPGTTGSALRATARAAELMKWGMNTEMTEDEIKQTVEGIVANVPEDGKDDFNEAVQNVYDAYCEILANSDPELLTDAGIDPAEYDFSNVETVEAVETAMTATGAIG